MGERRFGNTVPKLAGAKWEDVAPYLEEFLRRLQDANDETQESLDVLEGAATGTGEELISRRPATHVHASAEVIGLEKPYERRPPMPHTHVFASDIIGGPEVGLATARPATHVHRPDEIVGLIGDTQVILASQVFGG